MPVARAASARRSVHVVCSEGAPGSPPTGRTPNTDDLKLGAAGVETGKRGYIAVNHRLKTSAPGIWAIDDCNGKGGFTHTAYNDDEIVAANLLDGDDRKLTDRIMVYGSTSIRR